MGKRKEKTEEIDFRKFFIWKSTFNIWEEKEIAAPYQDSVHLAQISQIHAINR